MAVLDAKTSISRPRDITTRVRAQPAVPADRFAREIGGILAVSAVRSQRLNGNPLGCTRLLVAN
jgi:hypothetical protein